MDQNEIEHINEVFVDWATAVSTHLEALTEAVTTTNERFRELQIQLDNHIYLDHAPSANVWND